MTKCKTYSKQVENEHCKDLHTVRIFLDTSDNVAMGRDKVCPEDD